MPSDERIVRALEALSDSKEFFVSSVAMSAEEVRGVLERERGANENPQVKLAHELGPFAAERIDLERLAPFVGANQKLDEEKRTRVQAAYQVLLDLKKAGDDLFTAKVPLDGYLRGTVFSALGKAGTAFGAARAVELFTRGQEQWRARSSHPRFTAPGKELNVVLWNIDSATPGSCAQLGVPDRSRIDWIV